MSGSYSDEAYRDPDAWCPDHGPDSAYRDRLTGEWRCHECEAAEHCDDEEER